MNIQAFFEAPMIIQIHALSAFAALGVGAVQFLAPKGTLPHRTMGMVFVLLMSLTASTAIFIRQINDGNFSPIHVFVPLTFFGLIGLTYHAMKGQFRSHRRSVMGLYFGALIIPGVFTFLPGRLMWEVVAG